MEFNGTRISGGGRSRTYRGMRRLEHWYRDNQVYLITARCRHRRSCLLAEEAKTIFWDRFEHYTARFEFTPWVTSVLDNHYHTLGYLRVGQNLGLMMQKLHGSTAKLINDVLEASGESRHAPFWRQTANHDYFDGCIRDEDQCWRAYRYVLRQGQWHGVVREEGIYAHTRVGIDVDCGVKRALELGAFLEGVPYRRYESGRR